jgi:hypothetical protein
MKAILSSTISHAQHAAGFYLELITSPAAPWRKSMEWLLSSAVLVGPIGPQSRIASFITVAEAVDEAVD